MRCWPRRALGPRHHRLDKGHPAAREGSYGLIGDRAVGIPYPAVGHLVPCLGGPPCPRVHFVQRFPKDLAHTLTPSDPPRNRRADAVCCPPTGRTCLPNSPSGST